MIVGVVGNPRYEGLPDLLGRLADAGPRHGLSLHPEANLARHWPGDAPVLNVAAQPPDVILCFGGDGTLLRAARLVDTRQIPIYGINLGRVGFLTTGSPDDLEQAVARIAARDFRLEERRALASVITGADGRERSRGTALNDVAIHKAGVARVIRLRALLDGEEIGTFSADGLVVATPTGSTAYSLSAGGPIVVPGVDALVVTPICPHTLAVRPIVVPGDAVIDVEILPPGIDEIYVSLDGQVGTTVGPSDRVQIQRAGHGVRLIRLGSKGFFERMRRKLQWGDLTARERP